MKNMKSAQSQHQQEIGQGSFACPFLSTHGPTHTGIHSSWLEKCPPLAGKGWRSP